LHNSYRIFFAAHTATVTTTKSSNMNQATVYDKELEMHSTT